MTIHEKSITAGGWTGAGYAVVDPDTGAGAYLIRRRGARRHFGHWLGNVFSLALLSLAVAVVPPVGPLVAGAIVVALIGLVYLAKLDYERLPDQAAKDCFLAGMAATIGAVAFAAGLATGVAGFAKVVFTAAGIGLVANDWWADLPSPLACLGIRKQ